MCFAPAKRVLIVAEVFRDVVMCDVGAVQSLLFCAKVHLTLCIARLACECPALQIL